MTKINSNKKNLTILLIVCIILGVGLILAKSQKIEIITDKTRYENGGSLRVKIRNLSLRNVCFSSCYPYNLEKKNNQWKAYNYQACPHDDLAEKCLKLFGTKTFEISLPQVKAGIHRIAVSICNNCQAGQEFEETERFYSGEFEIQ